MSFDLYELREKVCVMAALRTVFRQRDRTVVRVTRQLIPRQSYISKRFRVETL
jgi:hypothetical protein